MLPIPPVRGGTLHRVAICVPGCSGTSGNGKLMASITLEKVSTVYPNGLPAVSELDLDVAEGELMVPVGPSGSGKTTALRTVSTVSPRRIM